MPVPERVQRRGTSASGTAITGRRTLDPDWLYDDLDLSKFQEMHLPAHYRDPILVQVPVLRRLLEAPAGLTQEEHAAATELAHHVVGADLIAVSMVGHDALSSYLAPLGDWATRSGRLVVRMLPVQSGLPIIVDAQGAESPIAWRPDPSALTYVDWRATIEELGPELADHAPQLLTARDAFREDLQAIVTEIGGTTRARIVLMDLPDPISLWPGNRAHLTWTRHFEAMGRIVHDVVATLAPCGDIRFAPIRQRFLGLDLNIADYVSLDGLHVNSRGQAFVAERVIEAAFS